MNSEEYFKEIKRIQNLMEVKKERSKEVNLANRLISTVSQADRFWAEKIKIIGFVITIFSGSFNDKESSKEKLKKLLNEFPELDSYAKEIRGKFKNIR